MDFTTSWRSDSSELLQVPAAGATKSRSDERSAKAQRRNLQPPSSARAQVAFACSIARRADPKNQKLRLSFFLSFFLSFLQPVYSLVSIPRRTLNKLCSKSTTTSLSKVALEL